MYSEEKLLELYSDAEFYDMEFAGREFELPFYERLLSDRSAVLEVACGTGRLTIPLWKKGIPIRGTDISAEMISKAQMNASLENVHVQFDVQDATQTTGEYDAIFIATNALQHFLDYQKTRTFFNACKSSLTNNGVLIIDIQLPDVSRLAAFNNQTGGYKRFQLNGREIRAELAGRYEEVTQIYAFTIKYYDGATCIKHKDVAMRMYFPQEIKLIIESAGFIIIDEYGGYDFRPLEQGAGKQIYVLSHESQ